MEGTATRALIEWSKLDKIRQWGALETVFSKFEKKHLVACALSLIFVPEVAAFLKEKAGEDSRTILECLKQMECMFIEDETRFGIVTDEGRQALDKFKSRHAYKGNVVYLQHAYDWADEEDNEQHTVFAFYMNTDEETIGFEAVAITEYTMASEPWFIKSESVLQDDGFEAIIRESPQLLLVLNKSFDTKMIAKTIALS